MLCIFSLSETYGQQRKDKKNSKGRGGAHEKCNEVSNIFCPFSEMCSSSIQLFMVVGYRLFFAEACNYRHGVGSLLLLFRVFFNK